MTFLTTNLTTKIATYLNITESAIAQIEEWARVLFVKFFKGSPRFVSKQVKEKTMELPELKGSKKQIKWANDIRNQLIEQFAKETDKNKLDWLNKQLQNTDAGWWIDNRKADWDKRARSYKSEIETYGKIRTFKEKVAQMVQQELTKLDEMVSRKSPEKQEDSFPNGKAKALRNNWELIKDESEEFYEGYRPSDPYMMSVGSEVLQMVEKAGKKPYTLKDF